MHDAADKTLLVELKKKKKKEIKLTKSLTFAKRCSVRYEFL